MSQTDKTDLGNRMKLYESVSTSRVAFKGQLLVARLDGKNFHNFTRGLKRPYDHRLSYLMVAVTKALVEYFQATVGYCQSDELTLVWISNPEDTGELPFGGRFQKIESLTAAYATAVFNRELPGSIPEKIDQMPIFDSRAFVVPNVREAYHAILWRQHDCTKNAISMAAQSFFSHKELQGKHGPEMQEMLFQKGVNFNDYPYFFKRGTFVRRVKEERLLSAERLSNIPEQHRPTGPVLRSFVETRDIWLTKQESPVDVLFYGAAVQLPGQTVIQCEQESNAPLYSTVFQSVLDEYNSGQMTEDEFQEHLKDELFSIWWYKKQNTVQDSLQGG